MTDLNGSQNNINQTVSGKSNQVAGRDIIIHVQGQEDDPSPNNPNLVTCPACGKQGIYHGADKCPRCQYSFENERLRVIAQQRQKREQGLQLLVLLGTGVLAGAALVSHLFNCGALKSLGGGVVIVMVVYGGGLWLWANIAARVKKWQGSL